MKKINLYFRSAPLGFKWVPGDRHIVNFFRRLFRLKKTSGLERVFINLCKSFDELNVDYKINPPFKKITPGEPVVVLGLGRHALSGYTQPNPVIAGIGLMTHPSEWPDLCKDYPVVRYLQHSEWTNNVYIPYYGPEICKTWPAGIDTDKWSDDSKIPKKFDFLVYNKIMWDKEKRNGDLRNPIFHKLEQAGFSYHEIVYGNYSEPEYYNLLKQSRAMLFLCEHESQGFACCEALSMNVPVFAWDQGYYLDPNRFGWGQPVIPATSVPLFDDHCGMTFKDMTEFESRLNIFWSHVKDGDFTPRQYVLENLTLKKSAARMLEIISEVYG
jgi:glycosyltransferase involved in cell wall biosynthesis